MSIESEVIGHDHDDGQVFFVKQESWILSEEECKIFDDVKSSTSTLSSKSSSSTCVLCHVIYHHNESQEHDDDKEGLNQARASFFNQQIYQQQQSKSSTCLNLISSNVKDLQQTNSVCFFCLFCATKIDHLHSLYNTLIRLQEEFDHLKTELVAEFVQDGQGQSQVDSIDNSKKVSHLTVKSSSSRMKSSRKTKSLTKYKESDSDSDQEFENGNDDDDDDYDDYAGLDYEIGNTKSPSDFESEVVEEPLPINVKQMTSCRVVVNRLNSATTNTNNTKSQQKQQDVLVQSSSNQTTFKTFSCTICHKTFSKSSNLCRHRVIHTQERKHKCEICSEGFNRRYQLTSHLKVVHQDGNAKVKTGSTKLKQCRICSKNFNKSSHLTVHLRIHSGLRNFQCSSCPKAFYKSNDLKKHSVVHSRVKNHVCEVCSKPFSRRDKLRAHLHRVHGLSPDQTWLCCKCSSGIFLNSTQLEKHEESCFGDDQSKYKQKVTSMCCEVCSKTFSTRSHLKRHLHTVHKWIASPLHCTKCRDVEFAFPSELLDHQIKEHNEVEVVEEETRSPEEMQQFHAQALVDARTCVDCGLVFDKVVLLKTHCRKEFHGEARKNQCEFCGKCFTHKDSLKTHTARVHQKIKRFPCLNCSESFITKRQLLRHTQIHTGKAQFTCTFCEASFNHNGNLRKHSVESHSEEYLVKANKPFVCKVCWQNFELESGLEQHQGSAHFKCHICNKLLTGAAKLQVHLYTHTGEKPFTCQHCGKGFNHTFNLAEHERTHTGEKRYKCTGCEQGLVRKKYLETHIQKIHPGLWSAQLEEEEVEKLQ